MRKYKEIENGIIVSIGESLTNGTTISDEEYNTILSKIHNKPIADSGYDYQLKSDLTWELFEVPAVDDEQKHSYTKDELMQMTNTELEIILAGYGVSASMTKANLIRLILSLQGGDAYA